MLIMNIFCRYTKYAFAYLYPSHVVNWFWIISSDFQDIMYFISPINKLCILNVIYFHNKHAVQNKL